MSYVSNRLSTPPRATGLLQTREIDSEDSRVGCSARVQDEGHTEPQSSARLTLQDEGHTELQSSARLTLQDEGHTEPQSSARLTLQDSELVASRENTPPPLQKTDPSCNGVMTLTSCDTIVQR